MTENGAGRIRFTGHAEKIKQKNSYTQQLNFKMEEKLYHSSHFVEGKNPTAKPNKTPEYSSFQRTQQVLWWAVGKKVY